jgi:hypothetical protein
VSSKKGRNIHSKKRIGVRIEASTSLEYIPKSGSMKKHRKKKNGKCYTLNVAILY